MYIILILNFTITRKYRLTNNYLYTTLLKQNEIAEKIEYK